MGFTTFDNSDFASLSPDLETMIGGELDGDEKLVWVGRPRIDRRVLALLPVSVCGLFACGLVIFWIIKAFSASSVVALYLLLPGTVSLAVIATPFWAGHKASRTCYALTDRRAITFEPELWHGLRVRSDLPDNLRDFWRTERGDGSGDLIFKEIKGYSSEGFPNIIRRGFLAIDDVRAVEDLIRSTFPETLGIPGRMKFNLKST